ncbi:MAG: hypothetical protein OEV93_00955 [Candidatus Moranbacteria bacterium]|nr:hypothetical protein [Candidatus Moranbacteria bacterium]
MTPINDRRAKDIVGRQVFCKESPGERLNVEKMEAGAQHDFRAFCKGIAVYFNKDDLLSIYDGTHPTIGLHQDVVIR